MTTSLNNYIKKHINSSEFKTRLAAITPKNILKYSEIATPIENTRGLSFIIFSNDVAFVMQTLVALDGEAKAICILPTALSDDDRDKLLKTCNFDVIITDLPIIFAQKHNLKIVNEIEALNNLHNINMKRKSQTQWLIPTSGTTNTPKLVVHTLASLTSSLRQKSEKPKIWALFYDHSRFAGLQVILQSIICGDTLIALDNTHSIEQRVSFLVQHSCTHLSATPTLWRKILMTPSADKLELLQITLGGEAADQIILSNLKAKYPKARITHIYASTEAGVGFSISDGLEGFPTHYLNKPHNGVALKIEDDVLFIQNQALSGKYYNGDEFINDSKWINTGDMVALNNDRVIVIGRENGLINIGGDKVLPEEVKRILLECDLVLDALVYAKSNPITGSLVAANVVLNDDNIDASEAKKIILAHAKKSLKRFQLPRILKIVPSISVNATGKAVERI